MKNFYYFIPYINLGPPPDYKIVQELPLDRIKNLILDNNATFEVIRKIFCNNKVLLEKKEILIYKKNKWIERSGSYFEWKNNITQKDYCYLETQISVIKGKGLSSPSLPSFYINYVNEKRKNFISCGYELYGNPRVIMQRNSFNMWIDGHPAINIDKERNTTYSISIINPYKIRNLLTLEIEDLLIKKQLIVEPNSIKTINMYDIVKKEKWTGQIYLYGKRRAILFVINHDFNNIKNITTFEHSDPYRAEFTYQPRMQYLRNIIHKNIKRILN